MPASDADAMLSALRHRGPDGSGKWVADDGRAGLVHTRLAILDTSESGAQPMAQAQSGRAEAADAAFNAARPRYWLVFNGEIFNYEELRRALEQDGERFTSRSDTEVLLRLLVARGKAAVPMLAGMFAFAFYDRARDYALLARDAFGIKPLYYSGDTESLLFASEVNTFRGALRDARLSAPAIRDMLLWGAVQEPATVLASVKALPAGATLERRNGVVAIEHWHRITFPGNALTSDPVAVTRRALEESVRRHLVSDVPVGIFLSGGVDSTAVLALVRQVVGERTDVRTFSIAFDDREFDESAIARRTAAHFRTTHTEWRMSAEDGRQEVAGYLRAMDQPTIDGFNTWCASKLARREGMKVVLSGLGGDELFGGYPSFSRLRPLAVLHRAVNFGRPVAAALLEHTTPGSRWRRLAAFFRVPAGALQAFHVQRGIFTESEARVLTHRIAGSDPGPAEWGIAEGPDAYGDLASYLELTRYMRNQLLRDADVFSMAHGLELRVPLVDVRLFAAIAPIPSAVRTRAHKRLLIDAVPEIPRWVREQPKHGFLFPFQRWLESEFGELVSRADEVSAVPLKSWYRRWALAAMLLCAHGRAA